MTKETTKLLATLGLSTMAAAAIERDTGKKFKKELKILASEIMLECMTEIEENGDRPDAEAALNDVIEKMQGSLKDLRKAMK